MEQLRGDALNKATLWSPSVTYERERIYYLSLSLVVYRTAARVCRSEMNATEKLSLVEFCARFRFFLRENNNNILFTISCYLHKPWDQLGITYLMIIYRNEFLFFLFHLTENRVDRTLPHYNRH